jgi:predicted enzyme related to lactoylglutathione lyase
MTAPRAADARPAPGAPADAHLGRFVYHDLLTTRPADARRFYAALLGWTCTPRDAGGFEYTDVRAGAYRFGGMVPLDPAHGMPSHWTGYVAVEDVDAACARAEAAGGRVCVPPHEIPGRVGHFAVLNDPTGAMLSAVRFTDGRVPMPDAAERPVAGGAWWHELLTQDPERAAAFHAEVFGWEARPGMVRPGGERYHLFVRAGHTVGGMMQAPPALGGASAWQLYLTVDDVDATVARAAELGGAATWPALDVPGVGRMGGLADPAGAMFAVGRAA